ncbi:MAG: gluconate 2-dehydrogenase subunit 3 family protein [Pseudomonadales bacterium]|nr:gluconate 2-dehydrogenase subunit 3 family protein [Pseudomonadales bacterium]
MSNQETLLASDLPLSEPQREILRALVGSIIPASKDYDTPGANDPLIFKDILVTVHPDADIVASGLEDINQQSMRNHNGVGFADLIASDQRVMVEKLSQALNPFLRTLVRIIAQCYYRDDRVMKALGMELRPPFPEGFTVEEGDWTLLEPVRRRGKLYREVDV